jgi:NADPH-dependent ferric siderophore reductase
MNGAGGGYSPSAEARFHLLVGDHAALPAIAAALESMDPAAQGLVLLHLDHEEDRLDLVHPEGVELRWVIGAREQLLDEVGALDLTDHEGLDVFCHVERGITKQLRRLLVKEVGIPRDQISISAYWALGRVEDQFQAEKREPIGKIDD